MDSETIGDIVRSLLLVLAFAGLFAGLWPAIGGAAGVWAGAAESSSVRKPTGAVTAPWVTEISPSISWIHVEVSATHDVEVRIIALSQRRIEISNDSGFAAADDLLAIGGGLEKDGRRQVSLTGSHGGPVRYMIIVAVAARAQAQNVTEADLDYTLTWQVQKLDPMVFLMGLILFGMFFVTEYILSVKRDLKALSKRLDRIAADGGFRAAPSALGMPMVAPSIMEAPLGEPAPAAADRGGFFGRRARETAPPEEEAPPAPPAPTARYAAPPPPELYSPPPYGPPPPQESAPYTPPPPAARAAARPAAPPPAPAPAPPPAAPMAGAEPEPVSRVRCPQCKHIVPVYTAERPTPIKCPNCGKRGMLTK